MTPLIFLALALAGGVGASARYLVDGLIRSRLKTAYPWATTIINVSGSLVLGFITGLTTAHLLSSDASAIIGTGFLGGYTTFSTASYETVQLIKQNRYGFAIASGIGMLLACVAVAGLGLWLGSQV
ncbi:camphor resistance protein CrcB [Sanguibacter gelidistatuariae]|uniref:Fluoride-specific ion channel FluC n=1 Tax=Sanguibacter gelidistatuariae TaxID=1814289 RepID=A0A1G6J7T9_9MICO|nr:fluoride efflux transporter CrcB [Sanguibacter gelidistatuariae]SDC14780.1 camphor resistance protein CrcB [Sanguibacter gelidistatuariae]